MRYQRLNARLLPMRDNTVAFYSEYDPTFVVAFKAAVPSQHRRWIPAPDYRDRHWRVSPQYAQVCADLVQQFFGLTIDVPVPKIANHAENTTQLIKLEYLGAAKERGDGQETAFGWYNGSWSVIFPLKVLRRWFEPEADHRPASTATLYGILGVGRDATKAQIRIAHRRAARTWHPDISQEPDSTEQFRRIQHAWEVLSNPVSRAKYNAGLALTATLKHDQLPKMHKDVAHWRSPLKCGYVLCEGEERLDRFVVSRILQWKDIKNSHGQTMISYWPRDATKFERKWV